MMFRSIATAVALAAAVLTGCASGSSPGRTSTFAKIQAPSRVTVPAVQGQTVTVATALLKKARLRWRLERRYADQGAGNVVGAEPRAGATVAPGTEVALVVSRGPQQPQAAAPAPSTPAPRPQHAAPAPSSNGGTPSVNSREGQRALHSSPDCQHAPPPPPGYKGPVQC
jgi:beta-lactam-binding protein with PASTA domain